MYLVHSVVLWACVAMSLALADIYIYMLGLIRANSNCSKHQRQTLACAWLFGLSFFLNCTCFVVMFYYVEFQ